MSTDRKTAITSDQIRKHTLIQEDISPDALVWQDPVIDKDLSTPPSSGNAEGDRYIIASVASGDWTGHENDIAQYIDDSWNFYTPLEGWFAWVKDENKLYSFDGSSWAEFAGGAGVFEEVNSVVRQDDATADYDEDFVFGSPQLDYDIEEDHKKFFFDKSKSAFRAGHCPGHDWDVGNIGDHSFGCGYGAIASGAGAFSEGAGNIASAPYTHAAGYFCKAYLWGQYAQGGGIFPAAQYSRIVLRATTYNATPAVMYMNANSSYKLVVPASTAWRVDGTVIATTSNCGLSSSWTIKCVIHRDNSNNIEVIWNSVTEDVDEIDTAATITISADSTNKALEINITGKAATEISWAASIHLSEIKS